MAIADIIRQIDAYVLSLRHARELLVPPTPEAGHKEADDRNRKLNATKRAPARSSKPRIPENKSRVSRPATLRKILNEPVESIPRMDGSVARQAAKSEQPVIAPAVLPPQQNGNQEVLSSLATNAPIKSVRSTYVKAAFGTQARHVKPAVALAGSTNSKIVVVSAQEVQRERDQAAQSQVRRPRLPSVGQTGRRAFEALFRDETEPSKASDR
jgi:hypothetical protein